MILNILWNMNWIRFKSAQNGIHEINVQKISAFLYDGEKKNWILVLDNKNGIPINEDVHNKIINIIEKLQHEQVINLIENESKDKEA